MNVINGLLINTIILLCPLVINLFYFAYAKNVEKEYNNTLLDFSLLSSVYLFYAHSKIEHNMSFIVMLNIPLIIAFIKNRKFVSLIISIFIICIYYTNDNIILLTLIIEYIIYYIVYLISRKMKRREGLILGVIIAVNSIISIINVISFDQYNLYYLFSKILILLTFTIMAYLILYIFQMGEDIIKLHMSAKQLEREKQIRDSLFKITHEIKNPIAVCKTYLDMFDFNNDDHERYIPIVKEEIDKTLLLLQDFLAMNKIKIQKEILDINYLLEDIVSQFETVMKSKNIKFIYHITDDEIFIEGDYNRLSQVFINLIKNSIEALDENKESEIKILTEVGKEKIKILIYDNGTGIEREHLEKIKDAFYTTKKNGTGLGVSLSCEIIEAHNGTIEFTSIKDEWTEVEITLPISDLLD